MSRGTIHEPPAVSPGSEPASGRASVSQDASTLALPPGDAEAGPELAGPYVLADQIGAGGMGVVYRAHDPRLDRSLAVKIMRTDARGSPAQRLMREAQAMARVTHPNVVEIYDVGTEGSRVFIAMELVEGGTLATLVKSRPPRGQILDAFIAAGRGLIAAHATGLVHRDFKPDNVLIGSDGRVRVTDFGLACATSATELAPPSSDDEPRAREQDSQGAVDTVEVGIEAPRIAVRDSGRATEASAAAPVRGFGHTALTGAGLAMGTPRYMAPEQHHGQPTDARADQYAFCVALFEALTGEAPFKAESPRDLAYAKNDKQFHNNALVEGLPPDLRRALLRGLEPDASDRWPSMRALLAVLERARSRKRRIAIGTAVSGTILVSVGVAAALVLSGPDDSACDLDAERVDGVWGRDRARTIAAAVTATELPYAADTWARIDARVATYVEAWRATHAKVCVARAARGVAPDGPGDAGTHCLARRLAELDSVATVLEAADEAVVEQSVALVLSLAPPTPCGDPASADTIAPPPPDARTLAAWLQLGKRAKAIELSLLTGGVADVLPRAEQMLVDAQAAGWPPLRVQALTTLGDVYAATDKRDAAREAYTTAYWLAVEERLDRLAANAAVEMLYLVGQDELDEEGALKWARHARSAAERINDAYIPARVASGLGSLYQIKGQPRRAEQYFTTALDIYTREVGEDSNPVAMTLSNLGIVHQALGDYETALRHQERAFELITRQLGPAHPTRRTTVAALAATLGRLGRFDEAIAKAQAVVDLTIASRGEHSLAAAEGLSNLGSLEESAERYGPAARHQRAAMAISLDLLPDDHPYRAATQINLGMTLVRLDQLAEASTMANGARRQLERVAEDHPYRVYLAILDTSLALARGDAAAAHRAGEAGAALCSAGVEVEPGVCAEVRGLLGQALWVDAPAQRPRALALAREAERQLKSPGYTSPAGLRALSAFLARAEHEQAPNAE